MGECVTWVAGAQTLILTVFGCLALFVGLAMAMVWMFHRRAAARLDQFREKHRGTIGVNRPRDISEPRPAPPRSFKL